jgi:hypothetical protein
MCPVIHVILTTPGCEKKTTTKNKHKRPHSKKGSQKDVDERRISRRM